MQRLYRMWKTRLHYYYKSAKCGKTDQERLKNPPPDLPQEQWAHCVKHFGSPEFKVCTLTIKLYTIHILINAFYCILNSLYKILFIM